MAGTCRLKEIRKRTTRYEFEIEEIAEKRKGYLANTRCEDTHLKLKEMLQMSYFLCRNPHVQEEMFFILRNTS